MKKNLFFGLALLIGIPAVLQSQSEENPQALFMLGARYHRGFIIQHTEKLKEEITQSNPWCIEMDVNWHLRKRNVWEYCYCYPRTGFSVMYTNFDLPEVLGSAVSVYSFIEPYIRADKKLSFSFRFGLGPAFLTKVYDENSNPDNLFFSSHLSFVALLNFAGNYRLTDQLFFRLAGNFNHISNAGYSEPNLGMNFPSVNLGFDYYFGKRQFYHREKVHEPESKPAKNRFDFTMALAAKPTTSGIHAKRYPVYGLGIIYSRVTGRIMALAAGMEWVNDLSIREHIREINMTDPSGNYPDHNRIGTLAGIEWLFGRFIFYQQLGYYIYSPVKANNIFYQRYGLNFKINNYFFVGVNIKAHGQDADFMDIRTGFSWKNIRK